MLLLYNSDGILFEHNVLVDPGDPTTLNDIDDHVKLCFTAQNNVLRTKVLLQISMHITYVGPKPKLLKIYGDNAPALTQF